MGPASSSRSGMRKKRSDETVKPFWKRVATYLGGVFGKRPRGPRVSSSKSDTIGIGRPFYTDTIKRTGWEDRNFEKRDDDGDGAGDERGWTIGEPAAGSGENTSGEASVTSHCESHQPGDVLKDLKRRGVPIQHCSPRPLPPPPRQQQANVATSTDSMCPSHGRPDSTMQEERHPPDIGREEQSIGTDVINTESRSVPGKESMVGAKEKTTVAVPPPRGVVSKTRGKQQRRTRNRNSVDPQQQFKYSIQDLRHWNKTLVLTATGSREDWSTQRKRHSQQMQLCDKPKRKTHPVVPSVEEVSGSASDTLGNISMGYSLDKNKELGGRRHMLRLLPGSIEHIQINRPMRQDTRSELLHCQLDEHHETCGTMSECVVPGFLYHQATNSDISKRHPIVSNILKMLDANTQTSEDKSLATTSQDTNVPEINVVAGSSSELKQDADTPRRVEDIIAKHNQRELYSSYYKQVGTSSARGNSRTTVDSDHAPRQKLICDWTIHQRNQHLSDYETEREDNYNTVRAIFVFINMNCEYFVYPKKGLYICGTW